MSNQVVAEKVLSWPHGIRSGDLFGRVCGGTERGFRGDWCWMAREVLGRMRVALGRGHT